jgi:hypothetical protein
VPRIRSKKKNPPPDARWRWVEVLFYKISKSAIYRRQSTRMHNNNKSTRTLGTGCRKWSYKLDANPVRRKRQSGFWFASIDNFDFIHQNLE